MNCHFSRRLAQYERGVLTENDLYMRFVEELAELPSPSLVAAIPPEVFDRLRDAAACPADTKWLRITSCCSGDSESFRAAQERSGKAWRAGLVLWRDYFISVGEYQI